MRLQLPSNLTDTRKAASGTLAGIVWRKTERIMDPHAASERQMVVEGVDRSREVKNKDEIRKCEAAK